MFKESLKMAWQNIRYHKMRSFLTSLGIIIGVMSIISLITIVEGVSDQVLGQFADLGVGKLTVQVSGTANKRGITQAELVDLTQLENVASVSPTVSSSANISANMQVSENVSFEGRDAAYFQNNADLVLAGRGLTPIDERQHSDVALVNQALVDELFYGKNPIGQTLQVNGYPHTVIGIVSDASTNLFSSSNASQPKVVAPYQNVMRMSHQPFINAFEVGLIDATLSDTTSQLLTARLNQAFNYSEDRFQIISLDSLVESMETTNAMMQAMLTGIASISLVVGGIGIMNMMLVSVSERTTEIGLRKALGAKPSVIQLQFLIEAVVLSLIGGLIGMVLGMTIALSAGSLLGFSLPISWSAITLALGFSSFVGIIFGWSPARKASRLSPIEALRSM